MKYFSQQMKTTLFTLLMLFLMVPASTMAAPPQTMSYQAYLKNNVGLPVNAVTNITFKIYSVASGGTAIWSSTQSVTVSAGLLSVELGTPGNPLPVAAMNDPLWLGTEIASDGEASPRTALNSVNNAFIAEDADTLDGLHANEIIDAAADEVRTPISSLPATFSSPGAYYLTGNLDGSSGGLVFSGDNVHLDMMGFTIDGGGFNVDGIFAGISKNITIINGTVTGFGRAGVRLLGDNNTVIDVASIGNGTAGVGIVSPAYAGFFITGRARVIRCTAQGNGSRGFDVGDAAIVKDSIASDNTGWGMLVESGSVIEGNTVNNNGRAGIYVSTGNGAEQTSLISGNTTIGNGFNGIQSGKGATVINNSSGSNAAAGINAGVGSTVSGNTVYDNQDDGIIASTGSTISGNTAYSNQDDGIVAGSGSTVSGNTVYSNQGDGISAGSNSTIIENTAYNNQQWGILSSNSNIVRGNTVNLNNVSQTVDFGGLRVNTDSLVENNIAADNYHTGIRVNASDVVLRNNHVVDSFSVGGVSQCFYFVSTDVAVIGNTATGCTTEFAGVALSIPASRYIDNIGW